MGPDLGSRIETLGVVRKLELHHSVLEQCRCACSHRGMALRQMLNMPCWLPALAHQVHSCVLYGLCTASRLATTSEHQLPQAASSNYAPAQALTPASACAA